MNERFEDRNITEEKISLKNLFDDIWKGVKRLYWIGILLVVVLSGLFCFQAKISYQPSYEASATFAVTIGDNGASSSYFNSATAKQMAATFPYILQSGILSDIVSNDLGYETLPGVISASSLNESNLFTMTVTSSSAQDAYNILQSVIENYPQIAEFVVGETDLSLISETGMPDAPTNGIAYTAAMKKGIVMGLGIFVVILILFAMTHTTVRRTEDIKKLMNAKCIVSVPRVAVKRRSKVAPAVLLNGEKTPPFFKESIRLLCTRLEKESGVKTLLVTSAIAGEGKTTISVNLAAALAQRDKRVALVDCDLRNPSVGRALGVDLKHPGIVEYLNRQATADDIQISSRDYVTLTVIPGGNPHKHAAEILEHPALGELVRELKARHDYVILDTPPSFLLTDASLLGQYADHALFVIRQDYASRRAILNGLENLGESSVKLWGCVLNSSEQGFHAYGGYSYGKYGRG